MHWEKNCKNENQYFVNALVFEDISGVFRRELVMAEPPLRDLIGKIFFTV